MAALTTQNIVLAGTAPTLGAVAAAAAGDTAEVGDGTNTFLYLENTNGSTRTVVVKMDHVTLQSGDTHPDKSYTLGATTGRLWIPLRKSYANDAQNGVGRCKFTVSADTGVTAAVVRMG